MASQLLEDLNVKKKNPADILNNLTQSNMQNMTLAAKPITQSNMNNITPAATVNPSMPNVGIEQLNFPGNLAGRLAQNNVIPNTSDELVNSQLRAIYSGQRAQIDQAQTAAMERFLQTQKTQQMLTQQAGNENILRTGILDNLGNVQPGEIPSTFKQDVENVLQKTIAEGTVGAVGGSVVPGLGTTAGGIIGIGSGVVHGFYDLSKERKEDVQSAFSRVQKAQSNMGWILREVNAGRMSPMRATYLWQEAEQTIVDSEALIKRRSEEPIYWLRTGKNELGKIEEYKVRLPQLRDNLRMSILQPNPLATYNDFALSETP